MSREDEPVAMARHRADEARAARVVAQRTADRANRLRQRAVGDDDVGPDPLEDVTTMHRFVAALDEEDEQVEVAGDERLLASVAQQQPATGREHEFGEPIARHAQENSEVGTRSGEPFAFCIVH